MVLTIKNFGNPVGPGIVETAPTNLVGVAGTLKATLTWTSATGESGVVWTEEKLVRKEGSAPQGSLDGTVVTTITTKDTYSSTGYEDTGLDHTKTYYYKVFAVYDNGTERGSSDVNVTPGAKREFYYDFVSAGSPSQLKLDGWIYDRDSLGGGQGPEDGWEITVNGLHNTVSSGNKFGGVLCLHGINLSSINKITIVGNYVINSGSGTGGSGILILDNVHPNETFSCISAILSESNSGNNGYGVVVGNNSSYNRTTLSSGTYTLTGVYDLVNKIATVNVTGKADKTLSITDSQIDSIRTCGYIYVRFDNRGCYCKDIRMTVE